MTAHQLRVLPVPGHGAEDVLVDDGGWVYTGTEDGSVFRVRPDGNRIDRVGHTGGRPLGLEHLADGRLLVCDARRGLLALDPADGSVEELLTRVDDREMLFCNNAAVAGAGEIFFTDSSLVHPIDRWKAEMVQDTRTGRLLCRRPDGAVEMLVDGLAFANGVALSSGEDYVAVAQTGGRRVTRHWLRGPQAGRTEDLVADLPGYPDNIALGSDGLVWVTIASPTDPVLERLMRAPVPVRRAASRLPERVQPKPRRTARVMAVDDTGAVVHDCVLEPSRFHMVTGVREHAGQVWLGSLVEPAVAVFDLDGSGSGDPGTVGPGQ